LDGTLLACSACDSQCPKKSKERGGKNPPYADLTTPCELNNSKKGARLKVCTSLAPSDKESTEEGKQTKLGVKGKVMAINRTDW